MKSEWKWHNKHSGHRERERVRKSRKNFVGSASEEARKADPWSIKRSQCKELSTLSWEHYLSNKLLLFLKKNLGTKSKCILKYVWSYCLKDTINNMINIGKLTSSFLKKKYFKRNYLDQNI